MTQAVFFDVDFTLIYPGPMFRGEGYRAFCARYGMQVDAAKFEHGVASAASLLDGPDDAPYDAEIFVKYTRHIIEQMGGEGPRIDDCAREAGALAGRGLAMLARQTRLDTPYRSAITTRPTTIRTFVGT